MLINAEGTNIGLISKSEALDLAKNASLDLVQVSPTDASPIVCKLLNYGKHVFNKKKSLTASKIKVKKTQSKKLNLDHQQTLATIKLN